MNLGRVIRLKINWKQSLRPSQVPPADHCAKFLMKQLGATTTTGYNTMVTSVNTKATTPDNATGTALDLDISSIAGSSSHNEQQQSAASMFEGLSVINIATVLLLILVPS